MEYRSINRTELNQKMANTAIDNSHPMAGLALVNVLGEDAFERKHIPNSINIPVDEIDRFEQRFSKDKDIVLYCASAECNASPRVAEALSERGFVRVFDYEGGVSDWENGSQPVAGRAATLSRTPS